MHGSLRAMLQFAGATIDGETSAVYPPLLEGDVRHLHRTRGDRDADPSRIGAARGV